MSSVAAHQRTLAVSPPLSAAERPRVVVDHPGPGARIAQGLIRAYQGLLSSRPSPCRFWPSCSNYALDALAGHGLWRGGWLTLRRLARCHPWGGQGVDPVPKRGDR